MIIIIHGHFPEQEEKFYFPDVKKMDVTSYTSGQKIISDNNSSDRRTTHLKNPTSSVYKFSVGGRDITKITKRCHQNSSMYSKKRAHSDGISTSISRWRTSTSAVKGQAAGEDNGGVFDFPVSQNEPGPDKINLKKKKTHALDSVRLDPSISGGSLEERVRHYYMYFVY